jgi:hypothetical protein
MEKSKNNIVKKLYNYLILLQKNFLVDTNLTRHMKVNISENQSISRKFPSLFLVVMEFAEIGTKSFLCNLNSRKKVIKVYRGKLGFVQPIDTYVSSLHRGCFTQLPSKLLSITPKKELLQNVITALNEQVTNLNQK